MNAPQFGVNLSTSAEPDSDPVADARLAETLGFDFVSSSDHPCGRHATNETWTMLTWVAASTSRIRIASRVLGVPFRNVVLLAKMSETLDRLSGGRLILGLGAGASDDEIRAMGGRELSNGAKITGLDEAVTVLHGAWTSQEFSFAGKHHNAMRADIEPKPSRRIPIWLGTFGDRALALTGRVADGWIPSLGYAPENRLAAMRDLVVRAAVDAGRAEDDVECILNIEVRVEKAEQRDGSALIGPPKFIETRLREFTEFGFTGFNFMTIGDDVATQHRHLAGEVVPALRQD